MSVSHPEEKCCTAYWLPCSQTSPGRPVCLKDQDNNSSFMAIMCWRSGQHCFKYKIKMSKTNGVIKEISWKSRFENTHTRHIPHQNFSQGKQPGTVGVQPKSLQPALCQAALSQLSSGWVLPRKPWEFQSIQEEPRQSLGFSHLLVSTVTLCSWKQIQTGMPMVQKRRPLGDNWAHSRSMWVEIKRSPHWHQDAVV